MGKTYSMPDEQPPRRTARPTTEGLPATQDEVNPAPPSPEYVDPYRTVYSPWELPANTAAAAAIANLVTVDPELKLSPERQAQAEAAIQDHQEAVQDAVGAVGQDPRLGGAHSFAEYNAKQAEAQAERTQARAEAKA